MNIDHVMAWFTSKLAVADGIVEAHGEPAWPDAEILLCCALSGLAAHMWPGKGRDERRFTQFLIEFAPASYTMPKVSLPVLVAKLRQRGMAAQVQALKTRFYPSSNQELVDGERIDQDEAAVLATVPELEVSRVRAASYVGIIYKDLRCGLVHEYSFAPYMKGWGMCSRTDVPTYVNMSIPPEPSRVAQLAAEHHISEAEVEAALAKTERYIFLPYPYIRDAVADAANAAFEFWASASSWRRDAPREWWIDGPAQTKVQS